MQEKRTSENLAIAASQNVKERRFWIEQLSGELELTSFPPDFPNRGGKRNMVSLSFKFPLPLQEKIHKLCGDNDIKLHMLLTAGLFLLLHKFTGKEDIVIGSPIARQNREGDFINTVLLFRNPVGDRFTFKELLLQVRATVIAANSHQNYPMEILFKKLKVTGNGGDPALFDTALLLESLHDMKYIEHIPYNMLFSFSRVGKEVSSTIAYNDSQYLNSTVGRLGRYYSHILDQALDNLDTLISQLEIVPFEDKERLIEGLCGIETRYPSSKTLVELFAVQAAHTPDRVAVTAPLKGTWDVNDGDKKAAMVSISYRELLHRSRVLSRKLIAGGFHKGNICALLIPPSVHMITAILGVLSCGGAYLPIDPDNPRERIDYILKDSGARFLVTDEGILMKNGDSGEIDFKLSTDFSWDDDTLDSNGKTVLEGLAVNGLHNPGPGDVAYVIYTSGSTGRPKGVTVEHGNAVAYIHSFYRQFDIGGDDTVVQLASYAFDVFIEEVFPILLRGGRVAIPHVSEQVDMRNLAGFIQRECVTFVDCTPLLLNEFNKLEDCEILLGSVRLFISGGDVLKTGYVDRLRKIAKVANTYGPTESTVCATYYPCLNGGEPDGIPIGKPVANYRLMIVDRGGRLLPPGINGELCVSGPGVTRGYLNRPELTAEKFIKNPYARPTTQDGDEPYSSPGHNDTGAGGTPGPIFVKTQNLASPISRISNHYDILYRTGDLVLLRDDGNIEFSGRIDSQVKIRGFRIETGEIENRIIENTGVQTAVVVDRADDSGEKYLCAYLAGNHELDIKKLKEDLHRYLPTHMVPSHFVVMDRIPMNQNGKVDKSRLPEPEVTSSRKYVAPTNPIEKGLVKIFADILKQEEEKIGINDDFFELGGDSLKLIKLTTRVHEVFDSSIPMINIFREPTILNLAGYIMGNRFNDAGEDISIIFNRGEKNILFCFPPAISYGIAYIELAPYLPGYSLCAFNYQGDKDLISSYADAIVEHRNRGPYVLFAYSAGGKLAMKTAALLERRGQTVSHIILMECYLDVEKEKTASFGENAEKSYRGLMDTLKIRGGEELVEKVSANLLSYQEYFAGLTDFKKIDADIHIIRAEDKQDINEKLGWEAMSAKKTFRYKGYGKHEQMLSAGFVEKNAGIVAKILDNDL